jgi:hypothetical protein
MRIVNQAGKDVFEHYVQVISDEYSGKLNYTSINNNESI